MSTHTEKIKQLARQLQNDANAKDSVNSHYNDIVRSCNAIDAEPTAQAVLDKLKEECSKLYYGTQARRQNVEARKLIEQTIGELNKKSIER